MPTNPITRLTMILGPGRVLERLAISISAVHKEVEAIKRAKIPLGTCRAPQLRPPWQTVKKRPPIRAADAHIRIVMRSDLRAMATPHKINPPRKNRLPETRKGGMVRTAYRVARNVEPQIT
jgi:hypothetical protein